MHTGVRCINVNANMFGGLDLVANAHDQDLIMSKVKAYEAQEPKMLKKTATIHSVRANVTHYLHQMYSELNKDAVMEEQVDHAAEKDLEYRRWLMVSSWNCTLEPPLSDQTAHDALCQQTALLSSPTYPPSKPNGFNTTVWHLSKPAESVCEATSKADTLHPVSWFRPEGSSPRTELPIPKATASSNPHSGKLNAVLVVLDEQTPETDDALLLLLRTLRAAGSTALVVIASPDPKVLEPLVKGQCGVQLLGFDPTLVTSQYAVATSFKPTGDLIAYLTLADYLLTEAKRFNKVLLVSADTVFQRDPFAAMPKREGLLLFVDDPVVSNDAPACFSGQLRVHELPALVSLKVVMGSAEAVRDYLLVSVNINYRTRRCPYETVVMLNVFRKEYAMYHPLALITPWDGPVTFVTDRQVPLMRTVDANTLLAVNLRGVATIVVTGYLSRMSGSRTQLEVPSPSAVKSTLDLVLSQVSTKLAPAIRQLNEYENPTSAEWPPDSKAFLRWSALGSMAVLPSSYTLEWYPQLAGIN